jgi:SpoIID/LytB domain protein
VRRVAFASVFALAVVAQAFRPAALSSRGIDPLAHTGAVTTPFGAQRLVVDATSSTNPTTGVVLLASVAAGADAAASAVDRIKGLAPSAMTPRAFQSPTAAPGAVSLTVKVGVAREGGGYAVRNMLIDEYVAGVLAGEAARDSGPAALEALAITVRTFAMANLGRHRADGFDLCDLTHCQVLRRATPATTRAADATAGRILLYRGAPASVFYTASCGGHTERPSAVWPGAADPVFLPSREDDACEGAPAWSADLTAADLLVALHAAGFKGDQLRDLRIAARNESGRVTRLRVDGLTPNEISGQDLRAVVGRTLGWQFVKSTAFDLQRNGSGFRFAGHGSGHGVGMCVIGSARLAAKGVSVTDILARYFPGLEMSSATTRVAVTAPAGPDVLVALPAGDEGERDVIRDLASRARDALASQLGVPVPERLTLRFHPTVESYQRATGRPWFTAGATEPPPRAEMQFVPLTVLRDRGVLEKTLRREIVHTLTSAALSGRPLWVREGAASYFAGEHTTGPDTPALRAAPQPRLSCPTDDELLRPVSPGALSLAYTRATACFAKQIAGGKKWTEVK